MLMIALKYIKSFKEIHLFELRCYFRSRSYKSFLFSFNKRGIDILFLHPFLTHAIKDIYISPASVSWWSDSYWIEQLIPSPYYILFFFFSPSYILKNNNIYWLSAYTGCSSRREQLRDLAQNIYLLPSGSDPSQVSEYILYINMTSSFTQLLRPISREFNIISSSNIKCAQLSPRTKDYSLFQLHIWHNVSSS